MAKDARSSATAKGAAKKGGAGDVKKARTVVAGVKSTKTTAKSPAKTAAQPAPKKAAAPAKNAAAKPAPKAAAKKAPAKAAPVKAAKAAPAKTATKTPAKATKAPVKASPVAAKKATPPAAAKKAPPAPVKSAPVPAPAPAKKAATAVPAASPEKGRSASAVAAAPPRTASAVAGTNPSRNEKSAQASMNSTASHTADNGITREDGRYALPASTVIDLPKGYKPGDDEEYMNPRQLAYFRNKLKEWREQLVEESRQTMDNLREEVRDVGDEAERATRETENSLELRTRDRYRKLISKIDKALRRIEEGRYGFCEETDEEIGVDRLDARPIATLSLDAQERREHLQKQMGD
ncbi:RNA polymerase-binding protein DksA [Luteibacter flocculans]|nr:RNA polymerase-binding protein DksA [Luteibacter flocculans]